MGTPSSDSNERAEAARLAGLLLRFATAVGHQPLGHRPPGLPVPGKDALFFSPSWSPVLMADVDAFLGALPSPALLSSGMSQGSINLTLVDELSGDRRRWAEKTISNQGECLEEMCRNFGFGDATRVLLEYLDQSHIFTLSTIRYWAANFAVDIGWVLNRLEGEPRAEACMLLMRADGEPFSGRSSMLRPGWRRRSEGVA